MNRQRGRAAALAGLALLAAATAGAAVVDHGDGVCSLNTIRGTYAWEMTGQSFDGGLSGQPLIGRIPLLEGTVFPVHMTGVMTVGIDGKATGTYSGLFGLVPVGYAQPVPWTATFTVQSDCTGVMDAPNAFGGMNTDVIAILDSGREIRTLGIAGAPLAWRFRMVRISRADDGAPICAPSTTAGRYLMQCDGFEVAEPGPPPRYAGVSPLFLLDVAADGRVAGLQFARDHPADGVPVTGMVSINADCTAQTTMQTEALPGLTILGRSVYYDNGKEAFGGPILVASGGTPMTGAFAGFGCHLTRLERWRLPEPIRILSCDEGSIGARPRLIAGELERLMNKKRAVGFGVLCAALSWFAVEGMSARPLADAARPDAVVEVYPTGAHPTDVQNVQAAVNAVEDRGTIVLKSTDAGGNPLAFNFGGTAIGNGGAVKVVRPGITITGDGWDTEHNEPRTKINGGGGRYQAAPTLAAGSTIFAVHAPGVSIRQIKMSSSTALTGVFITSALWPASPEPVVVEECDISVLNYAVIGVYSAAFPVNVHDNTLRGLIPVSAQWAGVTLRPIATFPLDEPVAPTDQLGNVVRAPFTITNNLIVRTPNPASVGSATVWLVGWQNQFSLDPNPDVGARRLRASPTSPWVYQHFPGDNGPMLLAGNRIIANVQAVENNIIALGSIAGGLNHTLVTGNVVTGQAMVAVRRSPYGHDIRMEANDLSGVSAYAQALIDGADTVFADNVLGPVMALPAGWEMPDGIPQPAVALISANHAPGSVPVPRAVEYCVLARNDYRATGVTAGSILLASQQELQWPFYPTGAGTGGETRYNQILENGRFVEGTGGAGNHVVAVAGQVNPLTGLPFVYDNRVVGLPASGITVRGIGATASSLAPPAKLRGDPGLEW